MKLLEITDWGLIERLRGSPEPLIVTVVDRLKGRHGPAARRMAELAGEYDGATFLLVDVAENPSLPRVLKFRRLPGVVVYADGRELRRWQGRVEKRWVASAVSAYLDRS
ncbi:MAG TPA: thioredoxin family protein [Planctomycetota bacterium]